MYAARGRHTWRPYDEYPLHRARDGFSLYSQIIESLFIDFDLS